MITPSQLKSRLDYDPNTGLLTWRSRPDNPRWSGRYAGTPALTANANGYRRGAVDGHWVSAHRVIFCLHYGRWPDEVDHINGDRADNRITNLRETTSSGNSRNQRRRRQDHCPIGVFPRNGRYVAQIKMHGKNHWLGTFDTVEEAAAARAKMEKANAFHPNHGR